jgi:hypothetical protein
VSASHTLPQFERDWEQINSYFGGHVLSRIEREKCGCWCYERPLDIRDDGQLSESYVIGEAMFCDGMAYVTFAKQSCENDLMACTVMSMSTLYKICCDAALSLFYTQR